MCRATPLPKSTKKRAKSSRRVNPGQYQSWMPGAKRFAYENIFASGDDLIDREPNDNTFRVASNNISASTMGKYGLEVAQDISVTKELGIDAMAEQETRKPWTPANRQTYEVQAKMMWPQGAYTVFSSPPWKHDDGNFQSGGTLLLTHGQTVGRVMKSGSDSTGRFCWMALRGGRDEGILIISGYRTPHTIRDNPGPNTAFSIQYDDQRERGIRNPNPRQVFLDDLSKLIEEWRAKGYRPIIALDANEDWVNGSHSSDRDRLHKFIVRNQLCDPYYNKFKTAPRTYVRGPWRLDYILIDCALEDAVKRVGYLGSHEGNFSDHTMCYIDFDAKRLFRGIVNRPTEIHSREFIIEQTDKTLSFTCILRRLQMEHKIRERVFDLARCFAEHGGTAENIKKCQQLDKEHKELVICAAKKAGHRNFGYSRSEALTTAGQQVILFKALLSCKQRNDSPSPGCVTAATRMQIDLAFFDEASYTDLRKMVAEKHEALWEVQKNHEEERISWIESIAQDRTRAAGDKDWEAKMNKMKRTTEDRLLDRRLTSLTKGNHSRLSMIQVATHDWFYSEESNELFRFTEGVFECYPRRRDGTFFSHHTLKVPGPDIVRVTVEYIDPDQPGEGYAIAKELPQENIWQDITDPQELEDRLLRRNKRHLQQVDIEGGPGTKDPFPDLYENYGINPTVDELLETGQFATTHDIGPVLADWFKCIQRKNHPDSKPVVGCMTKEQYQTCFAVANEKVSSGGSGLNYTLWKAMAAQDDMAEFLCILISLPFIYGFALDRWLHEIDVMLEKKKGNFKIHMLRIIGLLEADFNTALKFFFSREMMGNTERDGMTDEQWGGRRNRSSVDAAMLKLLTFECARIKKATIADTMYDLVACFDRMKARMSNIIAQRSKVDKNILRARAIVIENLRRSVKTGMGVSKATYGQETGEPAVDGEVQGKGDVPPLWGMTSDTLLRAHAMGCDGLCLSNPAKTRQIKRHNVCFVDDNDGLVSADHESEDPVGEAKCKMKVSSQRWYDLTDLANQKVAFHKTTWQMLAWEQLRKGELSVSQRDFGPIELEDHKGGAANIAYLPPDKPNVGLGYRACPDGNQDHNFGHIRNNTVDLCNKVVGAQLKPKAAHRAFYSRLMPKNDYTMKASYFTPKQCKALDTIITNAFLPPMKLNRNMPRAVIFGPYRYGGMAFPDVHTRQTQLHVRYAIQQLRWDGTVANDLIVTLDNLQLESGFTTPLFEAPLAHLDYIDQGWLASLIHRLGKAGMALWIEDCWAPKLQRDNDVSLMEHFLRIDTTRRERIDLSSCLKYMRVITVADLADVKGLLIPGDRLNGAWRAESTYEWPHQPKPCKRAWATLRRFLRETLCFDTSPYQPISREMYLSHPLGKWHDVPRNVLYQCYRTENNLFWQEEGSIQMFTKHKAGFFRFDRDVDSLPECSYPVACQWVDNDLWTHKPFHPPTSVHEPLLPPGLIISNGSINHASSLKIGSDGTHHHAKKVAAAAWIIAADHSHTVEACFVLCNTSSVSSTRAELEGAFRSLKHIEYLHLDPEETIRWIDNLTAVKSSTATLRPKSMLQPDADLVLAIQHITKHLTRKDECRHVYSHQDERSRGNKKKKAKERRKERRMIIRSFAVDGGIHAPSPEQSSDSESDCPDEPSCELAPGGLSDEAHLNNACDILVRQTAKAFMENPEQEVEPLLSLPYPGSKAMLRVKDTWITSNHDYQVHLACRTPQIRSYCLGRHRWSEEVFDSINWDCIETVRCATKSITLLGRTSKIMHGWLPIMHNLGKDTGITQCPGCECSDETFSHLFQCPHKLMRETRETQLLEFERHLRTGSIKDRIVGMAKRMVNSIINQRAIDPQADDFPTELQPLLQAQSKIGIIKFLQGFLANEWMSAMELYGEKHPTRRMTTLLRGIWDVLFEPLWATRNHILHDLPNRYNDTTDALNWERLHWYRQHRHEVLAFEDRDLADMSMEKLQAMTAKTRRRWISRLDRLRMVHERESAVIATGQSVLNDYFDIPRTPTRAPRQKSVCQKAHKTQRSLFDGMNISVRRSPRKPRIGQRQTPGRRMVQRTIFDCNPRTGTTCPRDKPP